MPSSPIRITSGCLPASDWQSWKHKGARPQRLLWASTGTKNKDYSDVLYVEELIGPDTVNTVPPATLEAFRDHGKLPKASRKSWMTHDKCSPARGEPEFRCEAITRELVNEGVRLFADAADKLLGAVAEKREKILGPCHRPADIVARPSHAKSVDSRGGRLAGPGTSANYGSVINRVWTNADEDKWLGWLAQPAAESIGRPTTRIAGG